MTPPKNVRSFNVPPRTMMDHMEILKPNKNKEIEDIKNLLGTEAGNNAMSLDNADGKIDGKITASVWNNYVRELFNDPEEAKKHEIQSEISVVDAMNSITKYKADLQAKAKQKPAMGLGEQASNTTDKLPDVTTQVEEDGNTHFYKKDPSQGEAGYVEISQQEYNDIRAKWEGKDVTSANEPTKTDNAAAEEKFPDLTSQIEDDGKRHYYKKDPSQGEAGYVEITQQEYDGLIAKRKGEV